jgi:hypothetical protein
MPLRARNGSMNAFFSVSWSVPPHETNVNGRDG